jgi:hypothetical protein
VRAAWRSRNTVVYLPLLSAAPTAALRDALRQGTALLFLRQLRVLEWHDHDRGEQSIFRREQPGEERCVTLEAWREGTCRVTREELVHVQTQAGAAVEHVQGAAAEHVQRQLFVRCEARTAIPAHPKEDRAASTSTIVVALPLAHPADPSTDALPHDAPADSSASPTRNHHGEPGTSTAEPASGDESRPPTYCVHAYLPLRDVGLRFVLHADFATTSSRDDVHDSALNRHLRSAAARLFVAAVSAQPLVAQAVPMRPALTFLPRGLSVSEAFWQPLIDEVAREVPLAIRNCGLCHSRETCRC